MWKRTLLFLAALATTPLTTSAQSSTDFLNSTAQSRCAKTFRANRAACARAILDGFPNSMNVSNFHSGEPADLYQLPRTAIGGSTVDQQCRASVDIQGNETVEGSWHYVFTMANMLMDACADEDGGRMTGGTVVTGQENGLVIIVQEAGTGL